MRICIRFLLWLLPLISLTAISALPPPPSTGPTPPPDIETVPPSGIYLDRARILDTQTLQEPKQLLAGQTYLLRIKTDGLSHVRNWIVLYYGRFNAEQSNRRLVEFRIDPALDQYGMVSTGRAPYLEWTFTLPDTGYHYDRGFLRLFIEYKKQNKNGIFRFVNYYQIIDDSPEWAWAINNELPVLTVYPSIGYVGNTKTDAEIQDLLTDLEQRFSFASKGYIGMQYSYAGRASFPADNQVFEGVLHDYVNWWNSVSHNLSGTDLLPLTPVNMQDLEMIKLAWYSEANKPQLKNDINAALPGLQSIMLTEAPAWSSTAQLNAVIGLYNSWPFQENGQYGLHKNFGWQLPDHIQKTILHEYGHTRGLLHPEETHLPDEANWTVKTNSLATHINVMNQGNLDDYPTDLFYVDGDINHIVTVYGGEGGVDAPSMLIPDVTPIGDPANGTQWVLQGKKEALAGITINGQEVIPPGDTSTSWSAPVNLSVGTNRYDVAQRKIINNAVRNGHPNVVYTKRLSRTLLPLSPEIQFMDSPAPQDMELDPGEMLSFTLSAQAQAGLDGIKWWVERKTSNQQGFVPILNMINWRNLYGSATATHEYSVAFEVAALYRIRAQARDRNHELSTVAEITLQVGNPLFLYQPYF